MAQQLTPALGQQHHRRQPHRRRRHHRHRHRGEVAGRRLHHAADRLVHVYDHRQPLSEAAVRRASRPDAGVDPRRRPLYADGASVAAGKNVEGTDRARQGAAERPQLRLGRHRHRPADVDGTVEAQDRHADHAYSVQGHRADADRSHRGSRPGFAVEYDRDAADNRIQTPARTGRYRRQTIEKAARPADARQSPAYPASTTSAAT